MKTYTGYRYGDDPGGHVKVHDEDGNERELDWRLDLRKHSPTGFEWGYMGSGPAQLALAQAADVLGDDYEAQDVYQQLKFRVVSRLPQDGWSLTEEQIRTVIEQIHKDRGEERSR